MSGTNDQVRPADGSMTLEALPAGRPSGPVGGLQLGAAPKSVQEAWWLAQMIAKSSLVPKEFLGKPEEILIALQLGAEIGLPPMQSLQSIAVINGRPSVWGDGFLAVLVSSPVYRSHDEYYEVRGERRDGLTTADWSSDDTAAVCTFWRRDREDPITRRFTVGQAKKANLLGKTGPWQSYPDRMLSMRARSWAGRDAFPDVLRGMVAREEAADLPPIDTEYRVEPMQPRRASEARTSSSPRPDSPPATPLPDSPVAAAPAPAAAEASITETRGLLITHTSFFKPPDGEPHYQITAVAGDTTLTFVTRDELLYKEAASFEGTDHQVAIAWQLAKTPAQKVVHLAKAIAIDETTPAPASLFR
jgi:hypothetical protein